VVAKAFKWTEDDAYGDELAHVRLPTRRRTRRSSPAPSIPPVRSAASSSLGAATAAPFAMRPTLRVSRTRAFSTPSPSAVVLGQSIAIAQSVHRHVELEGDPPLSKDIRFFFEPTSNRDRSAAQNQEYLQTIKRFLQVSPGSTVLRGRGQRASTNSQSGGEQLGRAWRSAMELPRQRAMAVHDARRKIPEIDKARVEMWAVGRTHRHHRPRQNRRVQWFTVE
jgi:NitT/TauT family transport system substrate-binding protein